MIRILWVYFNVLIYVLFHFIPIRKRYTHPEKYSIEERFKYIRKVCRLIVKRSGSKVIVEGRENLTNEPVLYVSNHPSMIDPYFVGYAVEKQMGAVIAGDLWFDRIPVLYPWFKSIGCIFVDRENPRKGIVGIKEGIDNIKRGHSLLIFPEGEITKIVTDDVIAPFHSGGLKLATKTNIPIVPIVIVGTEKVYTAHEVIGKLKKGTIVIKILRPYTRHINEITNTSTIASELQSIIKSAIKEIKKTYHI